VCQGPLTSAVERKVGRCSSCPATYDEELFQRLREWRSAVAAQAGLPPYVVFTDATLVAIAETLPADDGALAALAGVGAAKLQKYGQDVLELLAGSV
jgi:DNA helicase-2/ATP-dependent DNA helicase PcrA